MLGAHRCQAVTPSDLATALVALDATVQNHRPRRRALCCPWPGSTPATKPRSGPEIVTAVNIPAAAPRVSGFELRLWEGDFGGLGVRVLDVAADGTVRDARVVLGAIAPTPYRATAVEQRLRGRRLAPETIAVAAEAWVNAAHPLAGNEWKVDAACGLLRRCLDLAERAMAPETSSAGTRVRATRSTRPAGGRRQRRRLYPSSVLHPVDRLLRDRPRTSDLRVLARRTRESPWPSAPTWAARCRWR